MTFQKGNKATLGYKHTEEAKQKIREYIKAHPPKGIFKKGQHTSPNTEFKKGNKINLGRERPDIRGSNNWNWKGGIKGYSVDWKETLRKSIRERDRYVCCLCHDFGNTVHHIDYDKNNCNPENLITLCHDCHLKTNFNREKWKKYFKEMIWQMQ
jgi:hypothetical protein